MSEENKSGRKANRRNVLKSIGAATALSTAGVSISSARSGRSFEKILEASHRVLNAKGPEKQHEFLRNHGVGTAKRSITYDMPSHGSNDGMSTQTLDTSEITLTFSLFNDCGFNGSGDGTYVAELNWEYNPSFDDSGDLPLDHVGIGWDDNTWYYETNSTSDMYDNSDYVSYKSGTSGQGPAWEVQDRWTIDNGTRYDGQDNYFVGVHLVWNGADSLKDNRTIAASYSHAWSDVTISGVSVSYPAGVSVSVSNEEKEWNKGRDDNGNFLRLRYNDISGCSA